MRVELENGVTVTGTAVSLSGVGVQNGGDVEYTLYVSLPSDVGCAGGYECDGISGIISLDTL